MREHCAYLREGFSDASALLFKGEGSYNGKLSMNQTWFKYVQTGRLGVGWTSDACHDDCITRRMFVARPERSADRDTANRMEGIFEEGRSCRANEKYTKFKLAL